MKEYFKIVITDNFNRDNKSEIWGMDVPMPEADAKLIAELLNIEHSGQHSDFWAKVVPSDYKLYKFEP